jgi:hypothetical protein
MMTLMLTGAQRRGRSHSGPDAWRAKCCNVPKLAQNETVSLKPSFAQKRFGGKLQRGLGPSSCFTSACDANKRAYIQRKTNKIEAELEIHGTLSAGGVKMTWNGDVWVISRSLRLVFRTGAERTQFGAAVLPRELPHNPRHSHRVE